MLELYHAEPGANSMKCLHCLKEKGIEFVSHYVDLLRFEQHTPEFVRINPNGQVPVLVHDGAIVTESTVINEYLDEVFPDVPLRPKNPVERARMRIFSKFVDEYFCPALSMWGWHILVRRVAQRLAKDELEDSKRKVGVSIDRLEKILMQSPWIAGAGYSLADINAYPMVSGVRRIFPDILSETLAPRTWEWLGRIEARPATQAALAMPNKVPELLRTFSD